MPTTLKPNTQTLRVSYDGAFDWPRTLAWFGGRAAGGMEVVVAGGRYERTVRLHGGAGVMSISRMPNGASLQVTLRLPGARRASNIEDRVRRMFGLDVDIAAVDAALARDPLLAPLVAARPGIRVPGAWDGYEFAVRAILGQQISVSGASALAARLAERFGDRLDPAQAGDGGGGLQWVFPTPTQLAESDVASLGMPRARAEAIRGVARAAADDPALFEPSADTAAAVERLSALRGIGVWTAQYIAMRALRDADAFPAADLGILRALAGPGGRPSERQVLRIAEAWRPWRAYAAMHLWAADRERSTVRQARTRVAD